MTEYFRKSLDFDQNGFLDLEEIANWIAPDGFVRAKSEVIYLIERLDVDKSKDLTPEEILKNQDLFLTSQVTFFGQIYQLKDLRSQIFEMRQNNNFHHHQNEV
jgi:hypothetical protein